MDVPSPFYLILFQQFFFERTVKAVDICYYRNASNIVTIRCPDDCCSGTATSPESACCSQVSWGSFAVPIFVIGGICFLAVCLIYLRHLLKVCLCGCKCPCSHRFQVSSSATAAAGNTIVDQVHVINNADLPSYDAISKTTPAKDLTPPPYTFVASHPTVFGLEGPVPSAPPAYTSRCNSATTNRSFNPMAATFD